MTDNPPFFVRDGERFVPTKASEGYWAAGSLHGRVVIGLLGAELERAYGGPEFQAARLVVDMYRMPDLSPARVVTRPIRTGRRIRIVDAEYMVGDVSMARATLLLARRGETPDIALWRPADWDTPAPATLEDNLRQGFNGMWRTRPAPENALGARRSWICEVRDLVAGESMTPFARVALASDYVSPMANNGVGQVGYINTDVCLRLHRDPIGEWIGFETTNHQGSEGVAIGECRLYDEQGSIGSASATALPQPRPA
jgi:hypothetical protein